MIKVLIADDSPTARQFLAHLLDADPEIEVVGMAANGKEVLDFLQTNRPDVITMDIDMPELDGLATTRRIMETDPHPVVIVSGLSNRERSASVAAFEAGALAAVMRPHGLGHSAHDESAQEIIRTVKAMAGVKLVRRWPKVAGSRVQARAAESGVSAEGRQIRVVAIGASTGGPAVLKTILGGLPNDFSLPVVLVQHMSVGFINGFVEWLSMVTQKRVQLARHGETLQGGVIYVAPESVQMGVDSSATVFLDPKDDGEFLRPSVSYLFHSVARAFGPNAAAVLLTGMGRDGAEAMVALKERGAVTIAQSGETCVVNGMPMEAIKLGAVHHILPPEKISAMLRELAEAS